MPLFLCELFFGESLTNDGSVELVAILTTKTTLYQGSSVRIDLEGLWRWEPDKLPLGIDCRPWKNFDEHGRGSMAGEFVGGA